MSALQAFDRAARLGSIRRAAAELSISHTVLSRHLRRLEGTVGTRLVHTSRTGVSLTEDGARYHAQIAQALALVAEATRELLPRGGRGELRIWCAAGLATRWLTRRLPVLSGMLPGTDIVLTPADRSPDLGRREADIEVSYGSRMSEPGVREMELVLPRMFPVASPDFVAAHPPVRQPADLPALPLLHEGSRQQWRQWLLAAGVSDVPPLRGLRLSFADLALEAALQGQGVALANAMLVAEDLQAGRLVEVLDGCVRLRPYVLRASADRWNERPIRLLRDWIAAELAGAAPAD